MMMQRKRLQKATRTHDRITAWISRERHDNPHWNPAARRVIRRMLGRQREGKGEMR